MGWESSDRREHLPSNWDSIREFVLKRDGYRCVWKLGSGARCPRRATEVDHMGDRDDHRPEKLRSLCHAHHEKVTLRQAWAGRQRKKQPRRPEERHPGLR